METLSSSPCETVLLVGARSGRFPREILSRHPDWRLTVFTYDCHQARKVREDLAGSAFANLEILCAASLPKDRTWSRAVFIPDDRLMSAEMRLDVLQDVFDRVPGGERAAVDGVEAPLRRQVLARHRDFSATWTASVPHGRVCSFTTFPGCFCHRRPDTGGLALAETATRLVEERLLPAPGSILDMGCGCGFVGLLVARHLADTGHPLPHLTGVDSHARAILASRINAERLEIPADFLLSDRGTPPEKDGTADLVLSNPPYYGDWKIAELFRDTAFRALRSGGTCLSVAKNPEGLSAVLRVLFPNTEILRRRGYAVLRSTKT